MKSLIVLFTSLFITVSTFAQTGAREITIHEGKETIDRIQREGIYVVIELEASFVKNAWEKKVKEFGRIDITKGYSIMKNVTVPNVTTGGNSYSNVAGHLNGTKVFWAVEDVSGPVIPSTGHKWEEMKKILTQFAKQTYIDDINVQIIAAENALTAATKNQEKIVKEGESLKNQISNNEQERIDLENKLKANAANKELLNKNLESNKQNKLNSDAEVQKMQKALEIVKQRLQNY
ncbi:MAG: hypothetical protein U0U66_10100 [Cytophagaceae bacterium]